jgi:sec-independent protein translocase protein TatC
MLRVRRRAGVLRTARDEAGRMTLAEHLRELRTRLVRSFLAVAVGMVVAFVFYDRVFKVLTRPYCELPASRRLTGGRDCVLTVTSITGAFTVQLHVAMIVGVILSAPIWLYQLWAFITPGLHRKERRWALIFSGTSGVLFACGSAFGYYSLGRALAFLIGFGSKVGLTPLIAIDRYLSFVTNILLVFGASFEFPLLLVLLNFAGILSARRLAGAWRSIIFGVFVFAAVVTPSQDPLTMSLMAVPMTLLYGVALLVAFAHDRRAARNDLYVGLPDEEASPLVLDPQEDRDAQGDPSVADPGRGGSPKGSLP